eukprot:3525454-Pyramimonas_sp.AAC.1
MASATHSYGPGQTTQGWRRNETVWVAQRGGPPVELRSTTVGRPVGGSPLSRARLGAGPRQELVCLSLCPQPVHRDRAGQKARHDHHHDGPT